MRRLLTAWSITLVWASFSGCTYKHKGFTYMPDMSFSPAVKAQKNAAGSMLTPPKGTIARGYRPYPYAKTQADEAGRQLQNPFHRTKDVLLTGQALFNVYCIVCHGKYGEGDGPIVPKFPKPLSLQSDQVNHYPDGRIFHIVTTGQNFMPSYASQLEPEERWAVIHYLRALYRAKHPTPEDLKKAETW